MEYSFLPSMVIGFVGKIGSNIVAQKYIPHNIKKALRRCHFMAFTDLFCALILMLLFPDLTLFCSLNKTVSCKYLPS